MKSALRDIYKKLYAHFGPQHWWPARSRFEVIVGAILTQNTNWANVEKAINNLKKNKLLSPRKLYRLEEKKLAELIRSSGYYNIKARRLKNFLEFFLEQYSGDIRGLCASDPEDLRAELLSVKGIGQETADSILLYAIKKPVFVVDAYTKRVLFRHKMASAKAGYLEVQRIFMQNLKEDEKLFNEYHALLVKLGKEYCLKNKPRCHICPLK
jgi:endonuclease III related protein